MRWRWRAARLRGAVDWQRAAAAGRERWPRRASSPALGATGPATAPTWRCPHSFAPEDHALLTDPQTSGGLLVACEPAALDAVLACLNAHGFDSAAVVGRILVCSPMPRGCAWPETKSLLGE